jgi:hypothetical protein
MACFVTLAENQSVKEGPLALPFPAHASMPCTCSVFLTLSPHFSARTQPTRPPSSPAYFIMMGDQPRLRVAIRRSCIRVGHGRHAIIRVISNLARRGNVNPNSTPSRQLHPPAALGATGLLSPSHAILDHCMTPSFPRRARIHWVRPQPPRGLAWLTPPRRLGPDPRSKRLTGQMNGRLVRRLV